MNVMLLNKGLNVARWTELIMLLMGNIYLASWIMIVPAFVRSPLYCKKCIEQLKANMNKPMHSLYFSQTITELSGNEKAGEYFNLLASNIPLSRKRITFVADDLLKITV